MAIDTENQLYYILKRGDALIAYGYDWYKDGVLFWPAGANRWKCAHNANEYPKQGDIGGGGSASTAQAAVDLYVSWIGRFAYSQAPGRLEPLRTGYGDCSSTIWSAYWLSMGLDVGTWTGAMLGKGWAIASGSGANLPLSSMVPGDLVLFWWGSGSPSTGDHVEMYIGGNRLCGHGGNPYYGPTIKPNAQAYAAGAARWQVRRYA